MNTTPTQQPVPYYGEPWHEQTASINQGVHWLNTKQFNRAVSCVNACAGMADPAAEIQEMRNAIENAHRFIREIVKNYECGYDVDESGEALLANLQPFLKP